MEITLDKDLYEYVSRCVSLYREKTFLKMEKQKISYQEFYTQVLKLASYIQKQGLPKGFKAGLFSKNRIEVVIIYFAVILAGGSIVPINYFLTPEETEYIAINSGMEIFFFSYEYRHIFEYLFEKQTDIDHFILIDSHDLLKTTSLPTILKNSTPEEYQKVTFSPNDVAAILYTSGTTGHPKGAMLSHLNLISDAVYFCDHYFKHQKGPLRYIAFLPLFHSFSFMVGIICMMHMGAKVCLLESILPFEKIIKTILKERINILVGIPQIFRALSEKKFPAFLKPLIKMLFPIQSCISGGAPLPPSVWENFEKKYGIPIFQGYGLTEASPVVSVNTFLECKKGTVGKAPAGLLEVKVVDDNGNELKPGEIGELIIKGKNVMLGYWNKSEETAKTIKDGWLYTGDIASIDEEGFITIVDRKKDIIIMNGMNIYPVEIEYIIKKHPAVKEVAVIGVPDPKRGEIPVAIIEKYEGKTVSPLDIKRFCMQHEAIYKTPKKIEFWDQIPRNSTGKILKREVKRIYLENQQKNKEQKTNGK